MSNKANKRSMLVCALTLLLCVSVVVGSTYAWFTDAIAANDNVIESGELKMTLGYKDNFDATDWTYLTGTNNTGFFNYKLWEPGYTLVKYFEVKNVGTLSFNYFLNITTDGDDDLKLADVIDVYVSNPAVKIATRADVANMSYVGTLTDVMAKEAAGELGNFLKAGEADTVAVALKMKESAGNEYQGLKLDGFDLELIAVQADSEEDGFGGGYDADVSKLVYTANQLKEALANVESGGVIVIGRDIKFDADNCYENGDWNEGLYYEGDKSFTIDLNGQTITNDSAVNDYLMLFNNSGDKANTITIKNGTIEAASSAFCAICTSTTSTQTITINLENVNVIGNNSNGSVVKIRGGAVLNVKDGTVITGKDSYLGIENAAAIVNIYDGAEIYQNGTSSYNGCLVGVGDNGTVNVYGGYGKSVAGGFIAMTSGGTINVSGGKWIADIDGSFSGNDSVLIAQSVNRASSVVNVTGGNFFGGYICYGNVAGDAQINISGGNFDVNPTAYVASGYKAVESNGQYVVVADSIADENVIGTADELKTALSEAADAGSGDNTLYLTGDIDLTGSNWTPVYVDGYNGAGVITIEGNGATIKGLTAPLFAGGYAGKSGIVIKNLTIADSNIVSTSGQGGGAFIDTADSMHVITLDNCHLVNSTVTGERTGGLIGWCSGYAKLTDGPVKAYVTITNCSVVDSTVIGAGSAGAIAGHPGASDYTYTTIEDCVVKNVDVISNDTDDWRTGAIVGTANNGHVVINNVTVEDVTLTQNGVTAEETKLYGRFVPSGTGTLVIDGAYVLADATNTALKDAIAAGNTSVYLPAGEYKLPAVTNKTITISGTADTVIDLSTGTDQMHGMTFVFDGVTIKGATSNYNGIFHASSVTYKNCVLTGLQFLYAENVTFENCDFDSQGGEHSIWTYGSKNISFIGCDFTYNDRAVNVYLDNGTGSVHVSFDDCTFTTSNTASKGAVEINSSAFPQGATVDFVDCTAPAYGTMVGISGWDTTNGANATVTVDGAAFTATQWPK